MKYLKVFTDFLVDMEPLSFDERGRLFSAMLKYADDGTEPELTGNERFLWYTAKKFIDAQADSYTELCERNKRNITARYERKNTARYDSLPLVTTRYQSNEEQEQEQEQEHKRVYKFVPPSVEEVRAFVDDYRLAVDAERFVDFYASKGWMVGKNKMKDWRCAVRNWSRRDAPKKSQYNNADLERLEVKL